MPGRATRKPRRNNPDVVDVDEVDVLIVNDNAIIPGYIKTLLWAALFGLLFAWLYSPLAQRTQQTTQRRPISTASTNMQTTIETETYSDPFQDGPNISDCVNTLLLKVGSVRGMQYAFEHSRLHRDDELPKDLDRLSVRTKQASA